MATTKEKKVIKQRTPRKKKRKVGSQGNAYIQATFNNTIISVTESNGEVVSWSSAGAEGFKGARKSTPYAAQMTATKAGTKAFEMGMKSIDVFVKGIGVGRESAVRALAACGLQILSITDITPIPHNGCRAPKARRV